MDEPARLLLFYAMYPLWVAVGFADWACHRRSGIALTSGLKENLLHWLMFAEVGIGLLAVGFLQTNAAVLLILALVFTVHELTVYWDLHFTTPLRTVTPFEQMMHSFMEILPLLSLAVLAAVTWGQAIALVGLGGEAADFGLHPRRPPWPTAHLAAAVALSLLLNVLPLAQETWSCLKARTRPRPGPR